MLATAHADFDDVADLGVPATVESAATLVVRFALLGLVIVAHALAVRNDGLVLLFGVVIDQ